MNITDILIIIFILLGAFVGAKQGFTKALVSFLGIIIVVVLAYFLKNPVSELLMSFCPFFSFGGIIKGVTVLNIAVYEVIAFIVVFFILMAILNALLFATGIFETILKLKNIMEKMNASGDDPRTNLLLSLKPFLRKSRQDKMNEYLTILNVISALEAFKNKDSD